MGLGIKIPTEVNLNENYSIVLSWGGIQNMEIYWDSWCKNLLRMDTVTWYLLTMKHLILRKKIIMRQEFEIKLIKMNLNYMDVIHFLPHPCSPWIYTFKLREFFDRWKKEKERDSFKFKTHKHLSTKCRYLGIVVNLNSTSLQEFFVF